MKNNRNFLLYYHESLGKFHALIGWNNGYKYCQLSIHKWKPNRRCLAKWVHRRKAFKMFLLPQQGHLLNPNLQQPGLSSPPFNRFSDEGQNDFIPFSYTDHSIYVFFIGCLIPLHHNSMSCTKNNYANHFDIVVISIIIK